MNPFKEMIWLIRIYNSEAISDFSLLKTRTLPLKKSDFERIVGAPIRDSIFSDWFNELVKEGVLSFAEKIKVSGSNALVNGYTGNVKNIIGYINKSPDLKEIYDESESFFSRDKLF